MFFLVRFDQHTSRQYIEDVVEKSTTFKDKKAYQLKLMMTASGTVHTHDLYCNACLRGRLCDCFYTVQQSSVWFVPVFV